MAANIADYVKGKEEPVVTKKNPSVGLDLVNGKITKVYPHSEFLGVMFTGDIVDLVNGQKVSNTTELNKAVHSKCPGKVVFEFRRDEHCSAHIKPILPAKRPGFDLLECTLMWRTGGTPVGLLIHRDFNGIVTVGMVESGSAASKAIKAGDQLLKVNGKDVIDRDQARKLIFESINQFRRVVLILERWSSSAGVAPPATMVSAAPPSPAPSSVPGTPPSAATVAATAATPSVILPSINQSTTAPSLNDETAPAAVVAPPTAITGSAPSIMIINSTVNKSIDCILPKDVLDIMEENKNFFKAKCLLPACLKSGKGPAETIHTDLPTGAAEESIIPFDPSPKPLKATPKRVGA